MGTGVVLRLIEKFVAGRPAVGPEEAAAWAAEQGELGARRALLRLHPVLLHRRRRVSF
jgi:hypothetical protein